MEIRSIYDDIVEAGRRRFTESEVVCDSFLELFLLLALNQPVHLACILYALENLNLFVAAAICIICFEGIVRANGVDFRNTISVLHAISKLKRFNGIPSINYKVLFFSYFLGPQHAKKHT